MVKIIIVVLFGFLYQKYILPIDEGGKYTFSEVIKISVANKEELYNNGMEFTNKVKVQASQKRIAHILIYII